VCPGCGEALEPARDLNQILGYRAITSSPVPADGLAETDALADVLSAMESDWPPERP
jgi:hypothetical protein